MNTKPVTQVNTYTGKQQTMVLRLMKLCFKMDGFGFKSLAADFNSYLCRALRY
jgi:hypothetical protein